MTQEKWRTLLRVVTTNDYHNNVTFRIPAWSRSQTVKVDFNKIPEKLHEFIQKDVALYAKVNIGAKDWHDLTFEDWEYQDKIYKDEIFIRDEPIKKNIYEGLF